jgi:hypothetical protein
MKTTRVSLRGFLGSVLTIAAFALASVALATPPDGILDHTHANVRAVMAIQDEVTPGFMAEEGILGTAVGLDDSDQVSLVIFVDRDARGVSDIVRALPPQIRGTAVKVELTDKFRALAGKSGKPAPAPSVSHTAKQTPPIQLGTSGGWGLDLANGYCCGGTLGSLVQVNGVQYILSNYHVLEADIVSGGNNTVAATGQAVIQPGLIDVGCNALNAQAVGTLVKLSSLPGSNVDCAIAEVAPDMVRTDGAILEIGTISSATVTAALNQKVKKSGRTTRLTRSTVVGLNATISVAYDNECAGGAAFTKTFTGQIVIGNRASKFLAGGDSGSLMVEDVTTNPMAVGLLYAGSSSYAIANPIDQVLSFLGSMLGGAATMVGN